VTDLDPILRQWGAPDPTWAAAAESVVRAVAAERGLRVEYEPPDEEWLRLIDEDRWYAMVSARYPLAVATAAIADDLRRRPGLAVVEVSDQLADELSASPELLRATLLRYGWDEGEFDPARFNANDLFVESV
jgi:hypothetical protein